MTANLNSTFVVVKPDLTADALPVTDTIWLDLDAHYNNFVGHTLVAAFQFSEDWPSWEIHPHGDEIVTLISGDIDMILRTDKRDQSFRLSEPGEFVIVPKGTWHTGRVHYETQMIFVTPGQDTENAESPR